MDKLPSEVISSILKYLNVCDRRQMRLVNYAFYYASIDLMKKEIIEYHDLPICVQEETKFMCLDSDDEEYNDDCYQKKFNNFKKLLFNSKRQYFNLKFIGLRSQNMADVTIFESLGSRLISLHLVDLYCLTNAFVNSITSCCDNLKILKLEKINSTSIGEESRKPLLNLKSLSFKNCYISENQMNLLMLCAPNLTDFGIIYSRSTRTSNNSYLGFSSEVILNYLQNTTIIDSLNLTRFKLFVDLPEHIQLKSLILTFTEYEGIPNRETFISILSRQTSLEELKIRNLPCCFLVAISELHNLKYLHLQFHSVGCNNNKLCLHTFISSLRNMKHIKTLNIIPKYYTGALDTIPDCTLMLLKSLDCSIGNCLNIAHYCKQLTSLTITKYRPYINFPINSLKVLIQNLTNLMHLTINMDFNDDVLLNLTLSDIKGLISLKLTGGKITYKGLQSIKLPHLEVLTIECISLRTISVLEDVSDFEDVLKDFGYSVPDLIYLDLAVPGFEYLQKNGRLLNIELLRSYLPRMNYFDFSTDLIKARRF